MNGRRTLHSMIATGALIASLAGCGGSSSSDTLSRKQIDARANAICQAATKQGEAIKAPASFQDARVAAAYFDKVEPIIDTATGKLAALKPDGSVSADYGAYMKARQASGALIKTIRHKADTKDASGLKDLQRAPALAQKVSAAARKLGAPGCA